MLKNLSQKKTVITCMLRVVILKLNNKGNKKPLDYIVFPKFFHDKGVKS